MCIVYIEESCDTIFNMGYGSEKSPMGERVNKVDISHRSDILSPKKYLFYFMRAQRVLSYHLIQVPCIIHALHLFYLRIWNFSFFKLTPVDVNILKKKEDIKDINILKESVDTGNIKIMHENTVSALFKFWFCKKPFL